MAKMASISHITVRPAPFTLKGSLFNYSYPFFLVLLLAPLAYRSLFSALPFTANPWIALHMSYLDYGFIKRGFVATVLDILGLESRAEIVTYTALSLGIFLYLFLSYSEKIAKSAIDSQQWAIFLFLTVNPLSLFNVSWDAGRSDILGFILFVLSIKFINKNIAATTFFCCLGILNHEIYALLYLPALFLKLLSTSGSAKKYSRSACLLFFSSVTFLLLFMYGKYEEGEKALAALQQSAIGPVDTGIWIRTMTDNFQLCMNFYKGANFFQNYFFPFAYFLGCIYILHAIVERCDAKKKLIIFAPLLAVTPLSMMGVDVLRWLSLAFMAAVILAGEESDSGVRISIRKNALVFLAILICAGLIIGPIGIYEAFPLQKRLL